MRSKPLCGAAWPAATLTTADAAAPIPADVDEQVGGAHWPQRADGLPLRVAHDSDPLRTLLAAGTKVDHREHAYMQILAHPASARRVRAARRAAAGTTSGHSHKRSYVAVRAAREQAASTGHGLCRQPCTYMRNGPVSHSVVTEHAGHFLPCGYSLGHGAEFPGRAAISVSSQRRSSPMS